MFAALVAVYFLMGGSWWLFLVLFFLPDLTMLGYLAGPRAGARIYNLGHTYVGPVLLAAGGAVLLESESAPFAFRDVAVFPMIWAAHIAFDRMLGYGLKSPAGFKSTHLGLIGRVS